MADVEDAPLSTAPGYPPLDYCASGLPRVSGSSGLTMGERQEHLNGKIGKDLDLMESATAM